MNKLPKEKRQHLVLVVIVTAGAMLGLWFGLLRFQKENLHLLADKKAAAQKRLQQVKQAIETADQVEAQLGDQGKRLTKVEQGMATGDLYSWAITTIRQFKLPYKVEIPQFSQIDGPKDAAPLPKFPYKQASMTIGGTAHFYDLGKFIADFENQFPYMRIANLTLEPNPNPAVEEREKLSFRMEISALVKPNAS